MYESPSGRRPRKARRRAVRAVKEGSLIPRQAQRARASVTTTAVHVGPATARREHERDARVTIARSGKNLEAGAR